MRNILFGLVALFCAACSTAVQERQATPSKAVAESALAAYDGFFKAFRSDNHEEIVSLFAPEGHFQFYGTGSTEVVIATESVREYFVAALTSKRGETKATLFERKALALSNSVVVISGKWQSERTLDGKMVTAGPARNTVVLQKYGDKWLIAQFHNSPTPKPAAKPAPK